MLREAKRSSGRLPRRRFRKWQEKGYQGLDVDFEYLGQELAEAYAQFLTLLHERLAPYGLPLIAALAPKTSADQPARSTRATTTPPSPLLATRCC